MIKLDQIKKIERYENGKRYVKVSITSDTAAEVKAIGTDGSQVKDLLPMDVLTAHSICFTAEQNVLVLGSDGVWKE